MLNIKELNKSIFLNLLVLTNFAYCPFIYADSSLSTLVNLEKKMTKSNSFQNKKLGQKALTDMSLKVSTKNRFTSKPESNRHGCILGKPSEAFLAGLGK